MHIILVKKHFATYMYVLHTAKQNLMIAWERHDYQHKINHC